ncbi:hypothetical protein LCGC14_1701960, partial [marine sediment metagenome]
GGKNQHSGMKSAGSTSNESGMLPGVTLATETLFQAAANVMDLHQAPNTPDAPMTKYAASSPPEPEFSISKRQWTAIQKYPALIEALGGSMGSELVADILIKVNAHIIKKLEKNAKAVNKYAQVCVADNQNMKQYYVGPNKEWVCQVIASGPFRGDEVLYFDKDKNKSMVIRMAGEGYDNVSQDFNVIHEFAESPPEQVSKEEIPAIAEEIL